MTETFLETIVLKTRGRVRSAKGILDLQQVRSQAKEFRGESISHTFRSALSRTDRTNIIAEIKRASPSKGVINSGIDIKAVAKCYESGGAAAISVLTEEEYFGGSLEDLELVAQPTRIPVLRKDFIIDEYQIYEAAGAGADAVLLIAAALQENELIKLLKITEDDLGMDALVEVHTVSEMKIAESVGAKIIGVNNRDLRSLDVSLDVSRRLISDRPESTLMVAESGISNRAQIEELLALGFNAFLIGETLMRSGDIAAELGILTGIREPYDCY